MKAEIINGKLVIKCQNQKENHFLLHEWNGKIEKSYYVPRKDFSLRNKEIFRLREETVMTFKQIAEKFGISQTRVRKIYLKGK